MVEIKSVSEVLGNLSFTASFCCFYVVQIVVYSILTTRVPKTFGTDKQRAWILTGLNSAVSTATSIPYVVSFFAQLHVPLPERGFQQWNTSTSMFCGYFAAYLVADITLGVNFYPMQMGPSTGYFHHSLYTLLIPIGFMFNLAGTFTLMCCTEIPTLIMAMGQINQTFRSDLLFGATYFITRICLHVMIIQQFVVGYPGDKWLWLFPASLFPLHAFWFGEWCLQQIRLRRYGSGGGEGSGVEEGVAVETVVVSLKERIG
ncbi:hypothetical protein HDU80_011548 [Chytriomyces hyalinus]|nr:hypothetical protein HDU80_011548 [Chytriomyces hyalinus]